MRRFIFGLRGDVLETQMRLLCRQDKWLLTKADVNRQIGPEIPFLPRERVRPALYCLVRSVDGDSSIRFVADYDGICR